MNARIAALTGWKRTVEGSVKLTAVQIRFSAWARPQQSPFSTPLQPKQSTMPRSLSP